MIVVHAGSWQETGSVMLESLRTRTFCQQSIVRDFIFAPFARLRAMNFEIPCAGMESPISAKAALLQALVSKPGYGLDLIDRVKERTKGAVVLGQGSIYPALRTLEREGFLRSWDGETTPERGGRPRRYYELTAEGRRAAFRDQQVFAAFSLPALARRAIHWIVTTVWPTPTPGLENA